MRRAAVWICLFLAGCAKSAAPAPSHSEPLNATQRPTTISTEPLSKQMTRVSESLHGKRFSGLLQFEGEPDALFVSAQPAAHIDGGDRNTGKSSLRLAPGTTRVTLKLSSVLAGRDFPADWTLVGLFVRADAQTGLALSCEEGGRAVAARKVAIAPGDWTPAMLDISALSAPPRSDVTLELRFDEPTSDVRIDDVMLIDNRETLVDGGRDGWTVRRAGLHITCERKLRFNFGVVTRDGSPEGWDVEEANELRARFTSTGETKALTIYADGRSFWDGAYKPLSVEVRDDPAFAAAHTSPAEIAVPETMGRVNRNTPGDADNDGYNERLGAYQVQASGGRLEVTVTPRTTAVPRPVLQIAGLPEGKALITIEGRLVERSTRLKDGELLVELPARITRPTLITVRVQ